MNTEYLGLLTVSSMNAEAEKTLESLMNDVESSKITNFWFYGPDGDAKTIALKRTHLKQIFGDTRIPMDKKRLYLWALVDISSLMKVCLVDKSVETKFDTNKVSELWKGILGMKLQADGFYWQVFPVLTAAEAFIFYISVGSGGETLFAKVFTSMIGIMFVGICAFSFHVNMVKLDTYTMRLYWLETLAELPSMHSKALMSVTARTPPLFTGSYIPPQRLYDAWWLFLWSLEYSHGIAIVMALIEYGESGYWISALVGMGIIFAMNLVYFCWVRFCKQTDALLTKIHYTHDLV